MPEITTSKPVQVRPKGQITLPPEVRGALGIHEGDLLTFTVQEGKVEISRLAVVEPEQAYFWTRRWQKLEQEVEADLSASRVETYPDAQAAIAALKRKPKSKRRS